MPVSFQRSAVSCTFLFCLLVSAAPLTAQDGSKDGPPKVLILHREYLKPGKGGALHDKSESAFVKAMRDANYSTHYFALDSMSGPPRSLFMISYDSFADWERDNLAMQKNKTLAAAIDHATFMDGDLLSSYDSNALTLREDLSLNSVSLAGVRYFEISTFYVKPGKNKEWEDAAKMYREAYAKIPGAHWDVFQLMYGMPQGTPAGSAYVVITLMKSLKEADQELTDEKTMMQNIGSGGMKKLSELIAESTTSWTTNLFAINPRNSYPDKRWLDNDPDFWKVAPVPAAAKKPVKTTPPATP